MSQTELFTDASFTSCLLPFANFLPRSLTLSRKLQCQATKSYRFLHCLTLLEMFGTMLVHNSTQCAINMLQIISLKSHNGSTGGKLITLCGNHSHSTCWCLRGKVAKVRTNTSSGDHECLLKISCRYLFKLLRYFWTEEVD